MLVDLGNSLASVADPGVSRDSLDRLDRHVATAHDHIQTARDNASFGYDALNLPTTTSPTDIYTVTDTFDDVSAILTIGIGGSALGAKTITDALPSEIPHYTLDNVDPEYTRTLLSDLPLENTIIHLVSKSGTTTETQANFLITRDALSTADITWQDRTIISTGQSGPLRELATDHNIPVIDVPATVPGRFSALSASGLVPAALQGHDINAILDGASHQANQLTGSLYDCPAYAYGAITDALARRGITNVAFMPYAERLESLAEWFAQLWAESLGKNHLGQTPIRALGTTDQHSQLQLYHDGPTTTLVTLLRPTARDDIDIPATDNDALLNFNNTTLGELADAEYEATEASLARAGCPSVRIEIPDLTEQSVGELLYALEAACILAGELKGVNPFDQPAVDWGKQATRGILSPNEPPPEYRLPGKTTLIVDN